MSLDEYRRKRNHRQTPEPFGEQSTESPKPRFVIQRHDARRLHYDFRLERHGALASWAVPKGVPLRKGERHLAVHVEDHPLEYADFEGVIPAGEYGAGTVEIWDRGTYELLEEKRNGGLTVRLDGERLDGVWTLVPAHLDGDPKNWLLLRKDATVDMGRPYAPMLATATDSLPAGDGWLYEPKWDGFRAIVTVAGGEVTLTSRNGNDLTGRFPEVARAAANAITTPDAVLDGEICALDDRGRSRFSLLQEGGGTPVLMLFDLLELDSAQLLDEPLAERRRRLEEVVGSGRGVLVSPQFDDGEALLVAAREQELEGVVAKKADSRYQPGRRSTEWHKLKLRQTQEVVIAGYTRGQGRRAAGSARSSSGYTTPVRCAGQETSAPGSPMPRSTDFAGSSRPLERPDAPFAEVPKMPRVRASDISWVEPKLVAEVEFAEWTHEGRLRAPSYVRLRDDKEAPDVRRERAPLSAELNRGRRTLKLSNLDKLFWPDEGITKGDLIAYYRDVAEVLVPHLRDRPFTMKRYPDGWQGKHFFQKQSPSHMPEWIARTAQPASTREGEEKVIEYALVNDELALLWMANMGCIDLHAWSSRVDKPERPDWVMFDLDPSEGATFEDVVEVAQLVKQTLDLLELESFPKTSGSRGIHVLVPIARRHLFLEAREFAAIVGSALERTHPGLVTTEWSKAKRRGVLVDANQNRPGATNAMVYSVRPRAGAPVSAPLRWDEVVSGLDPTAFTMDGVLDRVAREGDLFAGVLRGKQSLKTALKALR